MRSIVIVKSENGMSMTIDTDKNMNDLDKLLNISSFQMEEKAEREANPIRKAYMLKYAKRKAEIEHL